MPSGLGTPAGEATPQTQSGGGDRGTVPGFSGLEIDGDHSLHLQGDGSVGIPGASSSGSSTWKPDSIKGEAVGQGSQDGEEQRDVSEASHDSRSTPSVGSTRRRKLLGYSAVAAGLLGLCVAAAGISLWRRDSSRLRRQEAVAAALKDQLEKAAGEVKRRQEETAALEEQLKKTTANRDGARRDHSLVTKQHEAAIEGRNQDAGRIVQLGEENKALENQRDALKASNKALEGAKLLAEGRLGTLQGSYDTLVLSKLEADKELGRLRSVIRDLEPQAKQVKDAKQALDLLRQIYGGP